MIFKKFIYSNKICMARSLPELQSNMSLKDAASSASGITRISVNYLHIQILVWSIMQLNEWKHFYWQFLLLSLWPLCLIVFLFCMHFCIMSHFKIVRRIAKSLIATSTNYLLKYNWKTKTWKVCFGCQSFGPQTSTLVPQTAQIHHWEVHLLFTNC